MTRILQGVVNFQRRIFGKKEDLFRKLGEGQQPLALFITCSDSRIIPQLLTQTEPGELFVLRNAGNLVPPAGAGANGEEATVEYAVAQLKVRDVILCGHAKCGAVQALLEPQSLGALPRVAAWLDYARPILPGVDRAGAGLTADEKLTLAVQRNVLQQLEHLRTHQAVKDALAARALRLHGWVYDFVNGQVETYDPVSGRFVALAAHFRDKLLEGAPPARERPGETQTMM
jgi:carbonic anhydrase